jgi:hypothetical protein
MPKPRFGRIRMGEIPDNRRAILMIDPSCSAMCKAGKLMGAKRKSLVLYYMQKVNMKRQRLFVLQETLPLVRIATVPTPWLDAKHVVLGHGSNCLLEMERTSLYCQNIQNSACLK